MNDRELTDVAREILFSSDDFRNRLERKAVELIRSYLWRLERELGVPRRLLVEALIATAAAEVEAALPRQKAIDILLRAAANLDLAGPPAAEN
jgi:hypothetical protein